MMERLSWLSMAVVRWGDGTGGNGIDGEGWKVRGPGERGWWE